MLSNKHRLSAAYQRIEQLMATDRCVILDGGVATELERVGPSGYRNQDAGLWGTAALYDAPYTVLQVHQRYVAVGCDVISTDTWSILSAPDIEATHTRGGVSGTDWMDIARLGIRLGRQAIDAGGRTGQCALAFAITGDIDTGQRQETISLLTRVLQEEPPDLILLETLSLIRDPVTYATVETLLETGLPVWLSFRRCRHGLCGVYGQHWGGPEGDLFGRAARRFEAMGVGALLINCVPPDHVSGMLPWLRNFTDMPLGVYPNLGYYTDAGWRFDQCLGPEEYARLARQWRAEGAQIVGGCCGVTPEHIAAVKRELAAVPAGRPDGGPVSQPTAPVSRPAAPVSRRAAPQPWTDEGDRPLYPLPLPDLVCEPGVFVPTQGSFLVWKHLLRNRIGAGKHCLDIGCGSGILTVQLALNGAAHVHAIDIQRQAVANTLANAFRNGVAERVSGAMVDLYSWVPTDQYDIIVASLYQMPVDPFEQATSHRPADYWGRNLLDHLISQLPSLLADGGVAYVMQLSILSQVRTAELADSVGLGVRVVDFGFFPFTPIFQQHREQIERVEQMSDAYHLRLGADEVMVAYLLEVTRQSQTRAGSAATR